MGAPKAPPSATSQTITQSNLPAYLEPFVTRMAGRAEEQSNRGYEAYGGPRISGFNGDQNAAMGQVRNLEASYAPQMQQAQTGLDAASRQAQAGLGAFNPVAYNEQRTFGADQANQYMNPFIENVIDRSRSGALQTLQEQKARANADTQGSAPFGSYGDIVSKSLLERDYGNRVADQDANLRMQGFNDAQQQFQRDRTFGLGMDQATNQTRLEAANYGMRGAEQTASIAGQQATLAGQRRGLAASDIESLQRSGLQQQQQKQASLDLAYQDFVNQRDFSDNRLQFMNNMVRGMPSSMGSDTTTYAPPANPYSQLLGLGTSAVGLAQAMRGA